MILTLGVTAFATHRVDGDRMTFVGPTHTDSHKDILLVTSSAPKRVGNELGNRRSKANLLEVQTVADAAGVNKEKDLKIAVDASIPVGTPLATVVARCAVMASLLNDPAYVEDLFYNGRQSLS